MKRVTGRAVAAAGGFTLFEVLIVLAIVALVSATMVPMIARHTGAGRAEQTAREIAAALRQARSDAIADNADDGVVIDTEQRTYRVAGGPAKRLPATVELSLVTAASEVREGFQGAIRFFPDGSSTGGEIAIVQGDAAFRVSVDWLTGRIAIARADGG